MPTFQGGPRPRIWSGCATAQLLGTKTEFYAGGGGMGRIYCHCLVSDLCVLLSGKEQVKEKKEKSIHFSSTALAATAVAASRRWYLCLEPVKQDVTAVTASQRCMAAVSSQVPGSQDRTCT